ncbi:signal peptidase II [Pseudomonas sp. NyZ704]|nr:signal peptidase II [Pseudomonas sp. NyZ704]
MPDLRNGSLRWLALSALIIALDLLSKWFADTNLQMYQQVPVIDGLFSFTLAYNPGAAFSFLANAGGWQRWFFVAIAVGVSGMLIVWLARLPRQKIMEPLALALILGGALGNLYDRIVHGHVVDFILVHWQQSWFFPAFNIADSAITVGAALLILDMFFGGKNKAGADAKVG